LLGVCAVDGECGVYAGPVEENGRHDEEDDVAQNQNGNGAIKVGHESFLLCPNRKSRFKSKKRNVERGRLTEKPALDLTESRGDDVRREVFQMVENLADEDDNEGNTPSINRVEYDAAA